MAFIQLLVSLWPFLKEMFVGEKIKDTDASKERATGKTQDRKKMQFASSAARWCVNQMQSSRRFLTIVLMVLILSLFINYKVVSKLAVLTPRQDEQVEPHTAPTVEKQERPTIPRPPSERDALYEQTVRELKVLYGSR
jgi:hypothetical protein